MLHEKCNLCGHARITSWFTLNVQPFYNSPMRRRDKYTIARCDTCNLVFILERPSDEELADVYDEGYYKGRDQIGYKNYGKLELISEILHYLERVPRRIIRLAKKPRKLIDVLKREKVSTWPISGVELIDELAQKGRLLDVGCATGVFLDAARNAGWEVTGVEFSDYSSSIARDENQLKVFTGTISSALAQSSFAPNSFDVVTLWDTMEHLTDPMSVLHDIWRALKDNGVVVIGTLNIDGDRAQEEGQSWHFFRPPKHLYYYGESTIKAYLNKTGFDLAKDDDFKKDCIIIAGRKRLTTGVS